MNSGFELVVSDHWLQYLCVSLLLSHAWYFASSFWSRKILEMWKGRCSKWRGPCWWQLRREIVILQHVAAFLYTMRPVELPNLENVEASNLTRRRRCPRTFGTRWKKRQDNCVLMYPSIHGPFLSSKTIVDRKIEILFLIAGKKYHKPQVCVDFSLSVLFLSSRCGNIGWYRAGTSSAWHAQRRRKVWNKVNTSSTSIQIIIYLSRLLDRTELSLYFTFVSRFLTLAPCSNRHRHRLGGMEEKTQ